MSASLYAFDNVGVATHTYLSTLYPYALLAQWLRGPGTALGERVTRHLALQGGDNCWQHHRDCDLGKSTEDAACRLRQLLGSMAWTSVHVGPMFRPLASSPLVKVAEHELVLDMDLNAWDDVRRRPTAQLRRGLLCCCADERPEGCCADCWALVELADVFVRASYVPDLGEPLWVYSGGKGAHCWFNSRRARWLRPEERRNMRARLAELHSPEYVAALARSDYGHALSQRLLQAFEERVVGGRRLLFARAAAWTWLQQQASVACSLSDSASRWAAFRSRATPAQVMQVVFAFALPLVDVQAAGDRHLIKLPFSVHAKTRRVALPLTPEQLTAGFDPNRDAVRVTAPPAVLGAAVTAAADHVTQWLSIMSH